MSNHGVSGSPVESFGRHPQRKRHAGDKGGPSDVKFTVGDAVSFLRGHDRIRAGSSGHVTACYISSRVVQVTCPPIECGQPGALTLDVPTDKLALDESSASASMRGLLRTTRPVA